MIAESVRAAIREELEAWRTAEAPPTGVAEPTEIRVGWDVLLWTVADDVRMSTRQLLEALGIKKSWLYARTSPNAPAEDRIPCRRGPHNELVFVVGEIRKWWTDRERIVHPGSLARAEFEMKHGRKPDGEKRNLKLEK